MGCPPVRGDKPRTLESGLSYVHVDKHGITILYHIHQCRPCTLLKLVMYIMASYLNGLQMLYMMGDYTVVWCSY